MLPNNYIITDFNQKLPIKQACSINYYNRLVLLLYLNIFSNKYMIYLL